MVIRKNRGNFRKKPAFIKRLGRAISRVFKIGIYSTSLFLIIFAGLHIYNRLLKTPYLSIKEINISGNIRLPKTEILELSGMHIGDNILSMNTSDIKKGIKSNPWVADASIARDFPAGLSITIKERMPVAFINLDGLYLVDDDGFIFKKASLEDNMDLPVITGLTKEDIEEEGAASELAIKAVNLIHLLSKRTIFEAQDISEINVDKTYGLTLCTTQEGARIELGNDSFPEKIETLEKIIQSRNGLAGVEFIGLNYNRGAVVRPAPAERGQEATGLKGQEVRFDPRTQEPVFISDKTGGKKHVKKG